MEIDIREKGLTAPIAIRYSSGNCVVKKFSSDGGLFIFDYDDDYIQLDDRTDCDNLLKALQHAKELGWF